MDGIVNKFPQTINFHLSVLLGMVLLLSACSNQSACLIPNTTALRIQLSRWNGTAFVDSAMQQGRVFHGPQGSFVSNWKNTTRFALPLAPAYDSLRLLIQPDTLNILPENQEIVTVFYQRKLRFVSAACGYFTEYNIDSVQYSGYIIDSVQVLAPAVNTDINPIHLRFVLKP